MAVATRQIDLFALTGDGLARFRVRKGSPEAEYVSSALEDEFVRRVEADPHRPGRLYATCKANVGVSEDGGATWRLLPAAGLDRRHVWSVVPDPHVPDRVFAGTQPAAFWVSEDGGATFQEMTSLRDLTSFPYWTFPPPPHEAHVRDIVTDARTPGEILLGVEEGGVVRSRDYGRTWEDISGPPSQQPRQRPGDGPYTGEAREAGRVHRDVHVVARHPTRLDTVYAGTGRGTYKTVNGGESWEWLGAELPHYYTTLVVVSPSDPERVYQTSAGAGPRSWRLPRPSRAGEPLVQGRAGTGAESGAASVVYRSDDGGHTWTLLSNGLPVDDPYMAISLALAPDDPRYLVVGYADGRVFASDDAGDHWLPLAIQLEQSPLLGVAVW
jgi:photosystem II stability/assembly factor-like uncharacterized protein